jgi:hypothetical protein
MSEQIKTIRRFFRRLHRSLLNSVPNDGPQEIDLSKLKPHDHPQDLEFSIEWRSPEQPGDVPGQTKT